MSELLNLGLIRLCNEGKEFSDIFKVYLKNEELSDQEIKEVLLQLSRSIVKPACTLAVARCFPRLVLQLLTLFKSRRENARKKKDGAESAMIALGNLVTFHPDAIRFSTRYFGKNGFRLQELAARFSQTPLPQQDRVIVAQVLIAAYKFLRADGAHFRANEDWSPLLGVFLKQSQSHEIKWLACRCIATATGMSDEERRGFVEKLVPRELAHECAARYDVDSAPPTRTTQADGDGGGKLPVVSASVVTVGGVQLQVRRPQQVEPSWFLASNEVTLRSVALAVANGKAVCLRGPVGCGKTALVEHLAKLTGRRGDGLTKVQLGEQTDGKTLLGTYQCTDVPGEFRWAPGVLTRAALAGAWLLLEDVDSASADVATIVTALLETGRLAVPGYRDAVVAAPGFQLFLTQRSGSGPIRQQGGSSLLEKYWVQVNLDPLTHDELVTLVETMFPALRLVSGRMVAVFAAAAEAQGSASAAAGRPASTRDLVKWCARSVAGFDVASRDSTLAIFQDALDIFCANLATPELKLALAVKAAACLGLTEAQAAYYVQSYKPAVAKSASRFTTGRVETVIEAELAVHSGAKSNFSFTRPSACLLESVACCVARCEPVLLVGETGTGKTSSVQYLAECTQNTLVVINMNQQSDSADLLGGYKPVDVKYVVHPICQAVEVLLKETYEAEKIDVLIRNIGLMYNEHRWRALRAVLTQVQASAELGVERREPTLANRALGDRWRRLADDIARLDAKLRNSSAMAFAFIEGSLVQALREGWWVLLDEINLASAETLECLSGLLEGAAGSLLMLERGDESAVERHPGFRLFACMNPATDVGKKELPVGLRNRFTELFVSELTDARDLTQLAGTYLRGLALADAKLSAIVKFYLQVRSAAMTTLTDGTGSKPHFSLRTLCRALTIGARNPCGSAPRSLYEALCIGFLTQLDHASHPVVEAMIATAVTGKRSAKNLVNQPIAEPRGGKGDRFVNFEGYWVPRGRQEPTVVDKYVVTAGVRRNLRDLARVVALGRLPVLVQGETAVGKTSLVTHLAAASGNRCVRINNHEHTDLQEYVGGYAADAAGALVFVEGLLVDAMRKGDWIILDELNLAPSDVLEALNRVLDDNRELFIPETRETVKAHPNFMLFATQNPPGLYGGRKVLSRAFRNRFVELHFNEIPADELEVILHKRCDLPPSYCKKLIAVMTELQVRRKGSSAFAGKRGFITLRDLFRWGERYRLANAALTNTVYDWDQHIADEGYLILAGRVRKAEEREVIREVLQTHIKRTVDPQKLFTLSSETSPVTRAVLERLTSSGDGSKEFSHVVWTFNMRRLAVLAGKALEFKEPVLLVGETGCGKTTICQLIAAQQRQQLHTVNCHMHSESSDLLGGLRPVRDRDEDSQDQRLFEWVDGPLIDAMLTAGFFLADEISLADDSVLERLNSLLEPERTLLLAEKCVVGGGDEANVVVAREGFHFVGTMNPGGDYGKKELSPALRNRFTEVWCEGSTGRDDLLLVIEHNLRPGLVLDEHAEGESGVGRLMLDFIDWFTATDVGRRLTVSVRDVLSWVNFINVCSVRIDVHTAYAQGAFLTFLDSLGSGLTSADSCESISNVYEKAVAFLEAQVPWGVNPFCLAEEVDTETSFGFHPFVIKKGTASKTADRFHFDAPTTQLNAVRVLRGLQLRKPILLEGSPGVGKTALVQALANAAGHRLARINLSDQTDVCDLFGSDLPVEGGSGGEFAWRDGPFLQALRAGDWILIDELNLASQSVLEGLNACLDHRGEVFVPELHRTFRVQPGTRLFAAQNPLREGGARRGLPKSFLNRFTQVFMNALTVDDMRVVMKLSYPAIEENIAEAMVWFTVRIAEETGPMHLWGYKGAPWEFNLRDLLRWASCLKAPTLRQPSMILTVSEAGMTSQVDNPGLYVELIFAERMRTPEDREKVRETFRAVFPPRYQLLPEVPRLHVTDLTVFVGDAAIERGAPAHCPGLNASKATVAVGVAARGFFGDGGDVKMAEPPCIFNPPPPPAEDYGRLVDAGSDTLLLREQLGALRSVARCVAMRWLTILVGPGDAGKTSVVRALAQVAGRELKTLAVNAAMDTTEILGGFEQVDYQRHLEAISERLHRRLVATARGLLARARANESSGQRAAHELVQQWETYRRVVNECTTGKQTSSELATAFVRQASELLRVEKSLSPYSTPVERVQLRKLSSELDALIRQVQKDGGTNAGGKFEWIDSVLVKCLREGCWLLLDNVNLASPAVLDRLNGLLEPDGVLTIGERGVAVDGKPFTIRPHPDFRLFMTLDPQNGEISRAMRNRGVELFMPMMTGLAFPLDTRALLTSAGLEVRYHAALVAMHRALTAVNQGDLGISFMLRAAFLLGQQVSRGFAFDDVFAATCHEIYARPNRARMPDVTIDTIRAIHSEFSPPEADAEVTMSELLDAAAVATRPTLSTLSLQEDALFATVKQRGTAMALLAASLAANEQGRLRRLLAPALQVFCETAARGELPIDAWMRRAAGAAAAESVAAIGGVLAAVGRAREAEPRMPTEAVPHLPLDLRWLPECGYCMFESHANKIAMFAQFVIRTQLLDNEPATKGRMSVIDYSNSVQNSLRSDALTDEPVVVSAARLLRQVNEVLGAAVRSADADLDVEEFGQMVAGMQAWFAFARAFRLPLLNPSGKAGEATVNQETLNVLYVNAKWVFKSFVPSIANLVLQDAELSKTSVVTDLDSLAREILHSLPHSSLPLYRVGKRVRAAAGQPFPFSSRREAELAVALHSVSRWLDIGVEKDRDLRIAAMLTPEVQAVRSRLIEAHFLLNQGLEEEGFLTVEHAVATARETFERLAAAATAPDDAEVGERDDGAPTAAEAALTNARVQLWPLQEMLALAALTAFRRALMQALPASSPRQEFVRGPTDDDLVDLLTQLPSVPVALVASARSALCPGPAPGDAVRALSPLLTRLLERGATSPAVLRHQYWSLWQPDAAWPLPDETEPSPRSGPALTALTLALTIPSTMEPNRLSSLGAHDARKRQLAALTQALWRNAPALAGDEFDERANEWSCAASAFRHLSAALVTVLAQHNAPSSVTLSAALLTYEEGRQIGKDAAWSQFRDVLLDTTAAVEHRAMREGTPSWAEVGGVWLAVGYLQAAMFANLGFMDPVTKRQMRVAAADEEVDRLRATLTAYRLHAEVQGHADGPTAHEHPFVGLHRRQLSDLESHRVSLAKLVAYRPADGRFSALARETTHYAMSLAHAEVVFVLRDRVLRELEAAGAADRAESLAREVANWHASQARFRAKLAAQYALYPDMIAPILAASEQLSHGMHILATELRRSTILRTKFPAVADPFELIAELARFPTPSLPRLIDRCVGPDMRLVLAGCLPPDQFQQEHLRLLRASLEELRNLALTSCRLDADDWNRATALFDLVVAGWRENQRKIAERKAEEDSMFVTRTANRGGNLSDDELAAAELRQLFPSTADADFGDVSALPSLERRPDADVAVLAEDMPLLTDDEVDAVCQVHCEIVKLAARTNWLEPVRSAQSKPDFVAPLMERYKTFALVMDSAGRAGDAALDATLAPSLVALSALTLSAVDGRKLHQTGEALQSSPSRKGKGGKHYDFYRDSRVEDVKECLPVLEALTARVRALLREWPDHPTLNQTLTIVDRVLAFPAASPVARFLTGLEILLGKLQEWEENAHKGVSLAEHSQAVTRVIVTWRRLELNVWKEFLANTARKSRSAASKWWFLLYSLTASYVGGGGHEKPTPLSELVDTLKRFIEEAPLGEFEARLDLLLSFHCHVTFLEPTPRTAELLSVLWNMHAYYAQFADGVDAAIARLRQPIEKKLRDFVKIARWNDISYWAIKETVEKTHRTLLKHVKEFQSVLKQPAMAALTEAGGTTDVSTIGDGLPSNRALRTPSDKCYLEPSQYVASPAKDLKALEAEFSSPLLAKADSLFAKSRKLCKDTILATPFTRLIQSVDSLVGEIIDTANHLKDMEVSKELEKDKQRSQAKAFLQQKRKALADLFRTLATLGLSFKLGLAEWATDACLVDWTAEPVDLLPALSLLKSRRCDRQLASVWEGCAEYQLRGSARAAALQAAMLKPSADLGPPNIERIRGFAVNLMRIAQSQKQSVTRSSHDLFTLRCRLAQLHALDDDPLPAQATLRNWTSRLGAALVASHVALEQFSVLLSSCPTPSTCATDLDFLVPALASRSPAAPAAMTAAFKGDPAWHSALDRVRSLLASAAKMKAALDKATAKRYTEPRDGGGALASAQLFRVLRNEFARLGELGRDVGGLVAAFQVEGGERNPMAEGLRELAATLGKEAAEFGEMADEVEAAAAEAMEVEVVGGVDVGAFEEGAEKLLEKALFAVQTLYKRYVENPDKAKAASATAEEAETPTVENDVDEDALEENHLKVKITEGLAVDIRDLSLPEINDRLRDLLDTMARHMDSANDRAATCRCKRILLRCLPCLDQLSLLAQYLVTQQVSACRVSGKLLSVLLSLFINLTTKGFCVPAELVAGEDGGSQEAGGGLGLGEGEGEKDVSDRIESQDQLDDARPEGEKRKDEEKDCKEEEKGIEMSDDFGGKTQDLEEKEKDEDDEESDKEDPEDKEMGETEDGADKLDQEIWGDDDEEPEEEEEGKDLDQEKGDGEKDGDPELGAKEDDGKKPQDDDRGNKENKDEERESRKKPEINEMQEPELDDDQVDPYHGNQKPEPEPEDLDLPDDMQLDDGDANDDGAEEDNPFDIDEMKEQIPPEPDQAEADSAEKPQDEDKPADSSDEEGEEDGEAEKQGEPDAMDVDPEEPAEEESGGKTAEDEAKPDEGDDAKEDDKDEEQAKASDDLGSKDQVQPAEQMDVDGSKDQVALDSAPAQQSSAAETAPEPTPDGRQDERDRVGAAQSEEAGHRGADQSEESAASAGRDQRQPRRDKRKKPGETDATRTLGDENAKMPKRLKTVEPPPRSQQEAGEDPDDKEEKEEADKPEEGGEKGDLFQHIKDSKQPFDAETLDAATKEQAEKQPVPNKPDEQTDEPAEDDVEMIEDETAATEEAEKQTAEPVDSSRPRGADKPRGQGEVDEGETVVEGDVVGTATAARGDDTSYHTAVGGGSGGGDVVVTDEMKREMRVELEKQLASWTQAPPTAEAQKAWQLFSAVTEDLARNLSEQLRLVLEPTQASRLRGDFRTGRRINMRKVIPYIASHYRKDKIWLRRTRPSKREYQIVLAVDDSSSMADNRSKELAFESLAVVSKALTLLEAGDLAVVSFGQEPRVLHRLGEPFTEQSGASLLQAFTFEQTQTRVGQLVDFSSALFASCAPPRSSAERSRLLVVVSDGRGVHSEGPDAVRSAVRRARLDGLFIVFVIVDNPETKDSILDIRVPTFSADGGVSIGSYLDGFPFPFYLILRDIAALPAVLGEALRQWFELVTHSAID